MLFHHFCSPLSVCGKPRQDGDRDALTRYVEHISHFNLPPLPVQTNYRPSERRKWSNPTAISSSEPTCMECFDWCCRSNSNEVNTPRLPGVKAFHFNCSWNDGNVSMLCWVSFVAWIADCLWSAHSALIVWERERECDVDRERKREAPSHTEADATPGTHSNSKI